jgi:putative ABC transport system substrate-binding protein
MRRRALIAAIGAAAIGRPLRAIAQQRDTAVVGLLSPFSRSETEPWHQAFREGLRQLGWVEGGNVRFEYRYADGHRERLPELVARLLELKPDVIVTAVTTDTVPTAMATKAVPIVMASPGDPVATGLIASLAHPGGNVTGLTQVATDLAAKRLQLLKEVAPSTVRVAVLRDTQYPVANLSWREMVEPARQLAMVLHSVGVGSGEALDSALAALLEAGDQALLPLPTPIFVVNERRIADFALEHRLASIYHLPEFPRTGGLLSYGPDRADLFHRAATYVDKILKGAKPGDLPVEQASKFQLVINLKTAKALGLTVPQSILQRADEVIE